MDSRLSRWLDGLLEACWLAAIIATPLFFNIHSERVFEPDKIALLRSLALVMGAAWCIRFLDQKGWQRLRLLRPSDPESIWHRPFALVTMTLLVVYLIATLFSVNPWVSWAGSYQRLQGTYTTLSYVIIFAVMATTITRRSQIRRVVSVAIVTSIPVCFYGLLQHFGLDPLPWGGDVVERIAGHMGNAIFIAAFLVMVVPLTLSRIIDAFSDILSSDQLATADVIRSSIYIFTLAIQLLAIYWSGSRGPLIGLGVGLFAFVLVLFVSLRDAAREASAGGGRFRQALPAFLLLLPALLALLFSKPLGDATSPLAGFAFFMGTLALSVLSLFLLLATGRGWSWLWLGWIITAAFAGLWLVAFNTLPPRAATLQDVPLVGSAVQALDDWRDLPTVGSYGRMLDASATSGREKSGRVRVLIWDGVVDLITPHAPLSYPDGTADPFNFLRPLIGYGPETMYVAYNRFYPAELATVEARNASPDRSHNETFDALVITGLLGFLAWQAVYLSVVYFAFRYLGVVRTRRDTWVFLGLLIGGALVGALGVIIFASSIYLGVAVPTGVMAGIIIYLIYYAASGQTSSEGVSQTSRLWPFAADRLLMNALVAAILAHYVEIHFGIAISVTRLYFFVFVALMVALAYSLPRIVTEAEPEPVVPAATKARRKPPVLTEASRAGLAVDSGWNQIVLVGLLLALALGVMGYSFITYALPPDKIITSSADLSAVEIVRQSLLQNAQRDFAASPFVFALFILTWALGWLVALSEMAKHDELPFTLHVPGARRIRFQPVAAGVFVAMGLASVAARFILPPPSDSTAVLGRSLLLLWGLACLLAGVVLFARRSRGPIIGASLASAGVALSVAVALAGAPIWALALAAICGLELFLLWSPEWRGSLLPLIGISVGSLAVGFLYTFLHAERFRESLFFVPPAGITSIAELRGLEAVSGAGLLTMFYLYVFGMVILMATAITWPAISGRGPRPIYNTPLALGGLFLLLGAAFYLIATTNVRVVQADMIFKRGRPFDEQVTRAVQADPAAVREAWDAAIAIYDQAVRRAPREDFYYLFLGRALLERSGAAADVRERLAYLAEAERRLLEAQSVNPLNTDHTANLARLYTRWYGVAADDSERQLRAEQAEQLYRLALELSPQNSIIRNEYARLALEVKQDCAQALALYDESVKVDPLYTLTYLARADAYAACGREQPEPARSDYFTTAAESLITALEQQPDNLRGWAQLAGVLVEIGRFEDAVAAIGQARALGATGQPIPELDFLEARAQAGLGDIQTARTLAAQALERADPDLAAQLEAFLTQLDE